MPKIQSSDRKLKILYVEDEYSVAQLMRRVLAKSDFADVSHVNTIAAAVALLHTRTFDIVLVDLGLPGVEGLDAVHAIHGATRAPIVVFSGRISEEEDDRFRTDLAAAGADGYITKGTEVFKIRQELRFVLARHHRREGDRLLHGGVA